MIPWQRLWNSSGIHALVFGVYEFRNASVSLWLIVDQVAIAQWLVAIVLKAGFAEVHEGPAGTNESGVFWWPRVFDNMRFLIESVVGGRWETLDGFHLK